MKFDEIPAEKTCGYMQDISQKIHGIYGEHHVPPQVAIWNLMSTLCALNSRCGHMSSQEMTNLNAGFGHMSLEEMTNLMKEEYEFHEKNYAAYKQRKSNERTGIPKDF